MTVLSMLMYLPFTKELNMSASRNTLAKLTENAILFQLFVDNSLLTSTRWTDKYLQMCFLYCSVCQQYLLMSTKMGKASIKHTSITMTTIQIFSITIHHSAINTLCLYVSPFNNYVYTPNVFCLSKLMWSVGFVWHYVFSFLSLTSFSVGLMMCPLCVLFCFLLSTLSPFVFYPIFFLTFREFSCIMP